MHKLLHPGDKIGLITPSGPITVEKLDKAIQNVRSFGLEPVYLPSVNDKFGYLAGKDTERIKELHAMFEKDDVKAVLCVRGGYGVNRILDQIDFNFIKKNSKPLIGFSDITALLSGIYRKTGLPGFHGIVGASKFTEYTRKCFTDIFMSNKTEITIKISKKYSENPKVLRSGNAEGTMIGGNLSILCSLLGTDYDIDWSDKIIFIEEINEPPYKIDRMLTQLITAGKFTNVKAVIFGSFHKCKKEDFSINKEESFSTEEVITERFEKIKVPSVTGFSFGHIDDQAIFPFGSNVSFNSDTFEISVNKQEFADFF